MTKDKVVKVFRPLDRREPEWPMTIRVLQMKETTRRLLNIGDGWNYVLVAFVLSGGKCEDSIGWIRWLQIGVRYNQYKYKINLS